MQKKQKSGLTQSNFSYLLCLEKIYRIFSTSLPVFRLARGVVFILALLAIAAVHPLFINSANAKGLELIRDAEVESVLKSYIKPMFQASGIPAENLRLGLVKDNSINAFATARFSIFVHTGLITTSNDVSEVMGVLAHETGHIAGGHLVRLSDSMKVLSTGSLISTILGVATTVITGRADVGTAVMMGGSHATLQSHLYYRQSEENAADEAARRILHNTGYSSEGFLNVMKQLIANEKIAMSQDSSSYLRTHPLTSDRANFLNNTLKNETQAFPSHEKEQESFAMIKAKLAGFLYPPFRVQMMYPSSDTTLPAKYARTISYFRLGQEQKALEGIDELIKQEEKNPYFYELKAQILFENGKVSESIPFYRKAVELAPDEPLIILSLAAALIEIDDEKSYKEAVTELEKVVRMEPNNAFGWRLLAVSAGRIEDKGLTYYAMAEYNYILGNFKDVAFYGEKAKIELKPNSARYIKLIDLLSEVEGMGRKDA